MSNFLPGFDDPPPIVHDPLVVAFVAKLRRNNHHPLVRNGRLFINNGSTLTVDDRAAIKACRAGVMALAAPWPEEKVVAADWGPCEPATKPTSLLQFLGADRPELPSTWRAPEPPDLTGIDEIVYNVATRGLVDWNKKQIIGRTVCTMDGQKVWFLPTGFAGSQNHDEAAIERWAKNLRGKKLVGSNIKTDIEHELMHGIDLESQGCTFRDVQHQAALLDDGRKRFGLDYLAKDLLGGVKIDRVDEERHDSYAADEVVAREEYTAQLTAELHQLFDPQIDAQDLRRVQELEDDFIPACVAMERNGVLLDPDLVRQYKRECEKKHSEIIMELAPEIGFLFEGQASWPRLFEKYHIPLSYLEVEGDGDAKASFKEEIIGSIDHPIIKRAHYAMQIASLNSRTFTPYNQMMASNGLLRYELNQLRGEKGGTVSGRTSAPYVQQVPNAYNHFDNFGDWCFPRRCYVAPTGLSFFEADAAQVEFRIFAEHAKNKKIDAAYAENPEVSFHKLIHAMLLPYKADMNYVALKSLNFATIYAAGLLKTAVMMGFISPVVAAEIKKAKTERTDPRLAQAREVKDIYNRLLPEIDIILKTFSHIAQTGCNEWCNKSKASRDIHARFTKQENFGHQGFVTTLLGRRSRFPKNYSLHKSFNRVCQGSGADIMKRKIIDLHNRRKETGLVMRCTIHDSVIGDIPNVESVALIKTILNEQSYPLRIPILWDCKVGLNWADAK